MMNAHKPTPSKGTSQDNALFEKSNTKGEIGIGDQRPARFVLRISPNRGNRHPLPELPAGQAGQTEICLVRLYRL